MDTNINIIIVVTVMAVVFVTVLILAIIICRKWRDQGKHGSFVKKLSMKRDQNNDDEVFINESSVSDSVFTQSSGNHDNQTPHKPTRRKTMPAQVKYENVELNVIKSDTARTDRTGIDKAIKAKPLTRHKTLKMEITKDENYENVKLMASLNKMPFNSNSVRDSPRPPETPSHNLRDQMKIESSV